MDVESEDQTASLRDFVSKVRDPQFPCVGAKSALARGQLGFYRARSIDSAWDDVAIHDRLLEWVADYREDPEGLRSFAVVFDRTEPMDEVAFERAMWDRLQSLADKDHWRGQSYDDGVSSNPADPHFSVSFGGEAFFVVGLHPRASRPARRFANPALIFNLHEQFETLRAEGSYERMREAILARDVALAGSINPMLSRFGETSEARQYSGRLVDDAWRCPFHDKRTDARGST